MLDPQAVGLWAECREALLFNDIEFGQWGLKILSPGRSAEVTASEAAERTSDFQVYDIVLGEFLGDQELLVLAPSEDGDRRVLVALPLDSRNEWYGVGASLSAFFERYLEAQGDKFWE
jgi:RNA 3'-terminal phosphate cyclase